jgi:hypothetical protein
MRLPIYTPLSSLITSIINTNTASDPKQYQLFSVYTDFWIIQLVIFVLIILSASIFAFTRLKPRSVITSFVCGLIFVPGLAIMQISLIPYIQYHVSDIRLASFTPQETIIRIVLNVLFYALIFFVGAAILTEGESTKTQNRAPLTG